MHPPGPDPEVTWQGARMVLALQTCSRMRGAPLEGVESFHADITSLHQREDEGGEGSSQGQPMELTRGR